MLLRVVDYSIVADPSEPIARAVANANNPPIVRAFNVAAFSPAGDPVIEVTPLFLTEVPELSVRGRIGARGFDQNRTFLEKVVSFPGEHQRRGHSDVHRRRSTRAGAATHRLRRAARPCAATAPRS